MGKKRYNITIKRINRQDGFLPLIPALIIAFIALGGGLAAASQNAVPGDLLYGLKNATEKARVALSFTHTQKAETQISIAKAKLEEIEKLQNKNASADHVSQAAQSLKEHQDSAVSEVEAAESSDGDSAEVINKLEDNSKRQQAVLQEVLSKVPDQAKPSIEHAAESSLSGLVRAQAAREAHAGKGGK